MSRIVIRLDRHVKRQLRCLKNKTREKGMAIRCQIVLLAAKGVRRGIIAESLGCSVLWVTRPRHSPYETVGKDPRRDTELAKRDNLVAIQLIKDGKFADAEKILKDALDADVTYGPAHNNLGKAYFHEGQFYLAAWEFQYASKLMPDVPEPRNNLGLVLESVGKLDDAVASYYEAVKLGPDNSQFLGNDARARYRRGDRDDHLRNLLEDLVMRDTRSDWSAWAKEQLALMGSGAATRP